jgi:hypothetical protein
MPVKNLKAVERVVKLNSEARDRGELAMWTVYDHPQDFPDRFVARLFVVGKGGEMITTPELVVTYELEVLREIFRDAFLTCLARAEQDDPVIMETWL